MRTILPSILQPAKYAYAIHSDSSDLWDQSFRTAGVLNCHIGMFETYGDGTGQHSGEWPVTVLHFTDFCLSFGRFLLATPHACDHGADPFYRGCLNLDRPDPAGIAFLAKVGRDDDRPAWYSLGERKVTTKNKDHDRRYRRVPDGTDGSMKSLLGLWFASHTGTLDGCKYYTAADTIWQAHFSGVAHGWDELGLDATHPGDHAQAFRGMEARRHAINFLNCATPRSHRELAAA